MCHARSHDDACGDAAEYGAFDNALHPARAGNTPSGEFELGPAAWRELPPLPPGIVVGSHPLRTVQVAVRLREAIRQSTWRSLRGSSDRPPALAVLTGADMALERLWARSGEMGPSLRSFGVMIAIAPGYSTWWGDPPFSALHAMARSAYFARLLARSVVAVPTVVWRYPEDLDRWAAWLSDSDCHGVCLDLALRSPGAQQWGIEGVRRLADALVARGGAVPRLLALGPSNVERMRPVAEAWPGQLTFLSQEPWWAAHGDRLLAADLSYTRNERRLSVESLLEANAATFASALAVLVPQWRGDPGEGLALTVTVRQGS